MILKAKHHWFIYPFFQRYTLWILHRHFHKVQLMGIYNDHNLPVMVLANHVSWWDGFWIMYLNLKVLSRKYHLMMLEEQLRKHWYFNYSGVFSVRKNSRSIIETMQYTAEILQDSGNMVFLSPQGEIKSMHEHQILFEKGAERIASYASKPFDILFVVNLVDYFSQPRPSLFIHFKQYSGQSTKTAELEKAYNAFFQEALDSQKNKADQ